MSKHFLLDTHVVLWLMFDVDKIPKPVLQAITNSGNAVYISSVSFWEISIKYAVGKLELNKMLPSQLPPIYEEQGFQLLPITAEETASHYQLATTQHRDPFDRMLIWQAMHHNLILISNDVNMPPYKHEGLRLLW
jgi:PIN domain nuclease of toxin-antitoxin system